MDKDSCSPDSERRDKAGLLEAARSIDASGLFAYWPRGDTGTSAATNALFGAYGAANPLASGRGSYNVAHGNSNSSVPGTGVYGNTLSVAASQAASLGINATSAAWWTMASHLAAQDYLARLHGMSFGGLPGAEALYPNFLTSHSGHSTSLSNKPSSKLNSSNSSTSMTSSSSKSNSSSNSSHAEREKDKEKENWTNSEKERDRDKERGDRDRDKDRSREKERDRERDKVRERDKERDLIANRSPMTAHSNSKVDHLSSIAALASSGTSISAVPPQAHSGSSDTSGILGGVRLPPDTEIIKYTSSIVGPKIPGTTNRGRKKTISLDPPSVSVMPTHSSTGIPIDLGQSFRSQLKAEGESRDGSVDHVEVIKLPAHSASNGIAPSSSEPSDEAPLNLCTKSRSNDDSNTDRDRISRRKPVPKQRRPASTDANPITSLSAMSQLFASETSNPTPSTADDDAETSIKDGRPRNLGRGVSKPKKNTVASLLAQSRALGWKGSLPGDIASQLAALKGPLSTDITSQLALLQNLQSIVDDPEAMEKRSSTPDNLGLLDDKTRVRTSEDGSFTTDSTSTGGSDSESEHSGKPHKSKRDKGPESLDNVKHSDKSTKIKDGKHKESKSSPVPVIEDREQKRNSLMKEQLLFAQELNKQKELLYAVELEKERRRQHMTLVRALETRKRVEERERKRIELRAEKIARQERKLEQRRVELEILKELRRPIEDMELDDVKAFPEIQRIPGLKLSGQAFADTLMVFEFLHNFGETLGFDMESLPTLNNLQGALLNDEENEEELLSIMTHLLVCAIEDPGIPNPARHITLLGQSLKQADITHTNISEILRIYLYANATGEVKALTGLNFERDREKKISEHHNLYGEEAQSQQGGKNAAFFEHLYENATYKLSEELKEKPFLALNPTTKSAILAFLCNELLQNKAVLRQIEGSLETVILSRRERWGLDQSIRKLRGLHDRQLRYNILTKDKDGMLGLNQQPVNVTYKEKTNDGVDSEVESAEESDHESECTQPEEEDQQNLNTDEINKRLEKLIKQQDGYLTNLRTSNQQIRAMCLGQDRFWRRYWCLPTCRSIFVEGMESAQPEEYLNMAGDMNLTKLCDERDESKPTDSSVKINNCDSKDLTESDVCGNEHKTKASNEVKDSKKRHGKRKSGRGHSRHGKKAKLEESSSNNNSDDEVSENDEILEDSDRKKEVEVTTNETDLNSNSNNNNNNDNNNNNGNDNDADCTININNNSDSENKSMDEFSGDLAVADNETEKKSAPSDDTGKMSIMKESWLPNEEKESPSNESGNSQECSSREFEAEGKENCPGADNKVKGELSAERTTEEPELKVKDKEVNCTEENIKEELKPLMDIKKEKENKVGTQEIKDYLRLYGEPLKNYAEQLDDIDIKKEKEMFYLGKSFEEGEKDLTDKRFKFEEEDPLLKAMKNELSSRIFGSPSNYIKKEELDDPHFLRNSSSPLANGEKFPGFDLLAGGYNLLRESEAECQWFSLLPKDSCDPNTIILGKNESEKMLLPMYLPTRGGLPPSPGPLPPCDSPAPLILSPEEAALLEQYKTSGPKPPPVRKTVPPELRRGWWRITDEDQLYKLLESLHGRGVRERELKRMLTRYLDNSLETGGKSTMFKPINDLVDLDCKENDPRVKFLSDGAPMTDLPNSWDRNVLQRVENLLLEQVENLEDKVASASMQVKGWKIPSRSTPSDVDDGEGDPKRPKFDPVEIAKERLISLEAAIERRYLKPPLGFSSAEGGIGIQADQDESIPKGLGVWREAVLKSHTAAQLSMALYMLESCIAWDKSIMKANCQFCQSGDNEDKLLLCDGCDRGYHMYCFKPKMDTIPEGDWYCHECKNKANGERNCIVCGKRPVKNFVLCEHCPRAYHADCLNPPLLKIPRTKWNCANCAIKFPKKKCGRKLGWRKYKDMKPKDDSKEQKDHISDDKAIEGSDAETDGEDVPLSSSTLKDGKDKECVPLSPIPSASSLTSSNSALNDEPPPLSPQQPTGVSHKKERISKKLCKELNACKTLIEEMESQDEAWPFLLPVNTKQFPTYKKIIKCPMDISTIKKRLTDGMYKTKEEFVYDVRQIFNNCETFNEDDSPVGKAGHAMRSFFETRWGELTNQKTSP